MPRSAQKPVALNKLAKPLPVAMSRAASPAPPPRPAKGSAARSVTVAGAMPTAMSTGMSPSPPGQLSPDGSITSVTQSPMNPTSGATDGLGAGVGGLAIHPSAKGANIDGYEPRHSSKRR